MLISSTMEISPRNRHRLHSWGWPEAILKEVERRGCETLADAMDFVVQAGLGSFIIHPKAVWFRPAPVPAYISAEFRNALEE